MLRQGAKAFLAANVASQLFALLRFVILARLLGPYELGLAAALILTSAFFESVSDTGADRYLVQHKDGESPTVQGVLHAVMAGRGVFIALGLALSAGLLAALYKTPELQISLIVLGAAPLLASFAHLDMRRVQRHGDFRPESTAMVVSETLSLAATAAAAWITRDHTAVIYGLVVRAAAMVAVSHLTAKRPYRWAFDGPAGRSFAAFAAPLAFNGLLMFLGTQGDRVVVGGAIGPEALGHYSAVLLLAYYPTAMLGRFLSGLHFPQLAQAKADPAAFAEQQRSYSARMLLLSAGIVVGFAIAGPLATPLFYGAEFAQALQIFALLACLQAFRFVRLWPTNVAVSLGRSLIVLLNNVARMAAIPLALWAADVFGSLEAIVGAFVIGEIAALVAALALLRRAHALNFTREMARVGGLVLTSTATVAASWSLASGHMFWGAIGASAALGALATMVWVDRRAVTADLRYIMRRLR